MMEGGDFVVTDGGYVPGTSDELLACIRELLFEVRTQKWINRCCKILFKVFMATQEMFC